MAAHEKTRDQLQRRDDLLELDPLVLQAVPHYNKLLNYNIALCRDLSEIIDQINAAFKIIKLLQTNADVHDAMLDEWEKRRSERPPDPALIERRQQAHRSLRSEINCQAVQTQILQGCLCEQTLKVLMSCCRIPVTGQSPVPADYALVFEGEQKYPIIPESTLKEPLRVSLGLFTCIDPLFSFPVQMFSPGVSRGMVGGLGSDAIALVYEQMPLRLNDLKLGPKEVTKLEGWTPHQHDRDLDDFVVDDAMAQTGLRCFSVPSLFWCAFVKTNYCLVERAAKQQCVPIPTEIWDQIREYAQSPPYALRSSAVDLGDDA